MTRIGLILCACLLGLAGCKSEGLPADPLFADRRPVESKTPAGPPIDTPPREPAPPAKLFFIGR